MLMILFLHAGKVVGMLSSKDIMKAMVSVAASMPAITREFEAGTTLLRRKKGTKESD